MSYCIYFKTTKEINPDTFFDKFVKKGEFVLVVNDKFPTLRFGGKGSLRGVEVTKEDDGYEVRLNAFSGRRDYMMFCLSVDILKEMTHADAIDENDEIIANGDSIFEDIEQDMVHIYEATKTIIRGTAQAVTMYGIFHPFVVGPRMLLEFGLHLDKKDSKEKWFELIDYLINKQWSLSAATTTSSPIVIRNNNDIEQTVSIIQIKGNKVKPFNYVSIEHYLSFFEEKKDGEMKLLTIIDFMNFRKSVEDANPTNEWLLPIDEYQMGLYKEDITAKEIKQIALSAKKYEVTDFDFIALDPGEGISSQQNTFILMWNAETSHITEEDFLWYLKNIYTQRIVLPLHEWQQAKMGDRFYMIKTAGDRLGIVMAGLLASHPYPTTLLLGEKRKKNCVELSPTIMLNPEKTPMITVEQLEKEIPNFMWRGGYSGRMLTPEQGNKIEHLFSAYLKEMKCKSDQDDLFLPLT